MGTRQRSPWHAVISHRGQPQGTESWVSGSLGQWDSVRLVHRGIELHVHTVNCGLIPSCRVDISTGSNRYPTPNTPGSKPWLATSAFLPQTWQQCTASPTSLSPILVQTPFLLTWTDKASQPVSQFPPSYSTLHTEARKNLWKCKSNHITPEFQAGSLPTPTAGNILFRDPQGPTWPGPTLERALPQDLICSRSSILNCTSTDWLPHCLSPKLTRPQGLCTGMVSPDIWFSLQHVPWSLYLTRPHSTPSLHHSVGLFTLLLPGT